MSGSIYTLKLNMSAETVKKYNEQGFKLCVACGFGDQPIYDVIAWCGVLNTSTTIESKEWYKIAASPTTFQNGAKFIPATNPTEINFQQVYTLPENWEDGTVSRDVMLKPGTFKFVNTTKREATVIIYKSIRGEDPIPVYVSETPVFASGWGIFSPKPTLAVWLQKNVEPQIMVSVYRGNTSEFDMSLSRGHLEATWDAAGGKFIVDK